MFRTLGGGISLSDHLPARASGELLSSWLWLASQSLPHVAWQSSDGRDGSLRLAKY